MDSRAVGCSSREPRPLDRDACADAVLEALRPVVRGLYATFGHNCEVVLHDFRRPDRSIVAIAGDVTGRRVGDAVTEHGRSLLEQGNAAQDRIGAITRTATGRVLKETDILLRDPDGRVIGALCINFDVTELRLLTSAVSEIAGPPTVPPQSGAVVGDIGRLIQSVIDEQEAMLGRSIDRLTRADRLAILRALDRRGVFALHRSVPMVAQYLGISRTTAYSYLEQVRNGAAAPLGAADTRSERPRRPRGARPG